MLIPSKREGRYSGAELALHANSVYLRDVSKDDVIYDEEGPQVLIRNPTRPGDE